MPTLHQLNATHKLPLCRPLLAAGDSLLLLESAVALALDPAQLQALPPGVQVLALAKDLQARGLLQACAAQVQPIDDAAWVAATLEADRVCSW